MKDKRGEGLSEKVLSIFGGKVLLKEEDSETSYIDILYLKGKKSDGSTVVLYPRNAVLREEDGKYLRLNRGDQIEVTFDESANIPGLHDVSIVAFGYYVLKGSR